MSKLIDADAIKFYYGGLAHIPYDDFIGIANYFTNQIKEMPTITPEPHWIPCSERLPERNGDYLCQENLGFLYVDTWNGEYWDCADRAYRTVIAWMPLPEPFKEVTE